MFEPLEGGCLCGRVRYRVMAAPLDGAYCHCRMCQKSSGAPLQATGGTIQFAATLVNVPAAPVAA